MGQKAVDAVAVGGELSVIVVHGVHRQTVDQGRYLRRRLDRSAQHPHFSGARDPLGVAAHYVVPFLGVSAQSQTVTVEDVLYGFFADALGNALVLQSVGEVRHVLCQRHISGPFRF
jgi:hypothetical protein